MSRRRRDTKKVYGVLTSITFLAMRLWALFSCCRIVKDYSRVGCRRKPQQSSITTVVKSHKWGVSYAPAPSDIIWLVVTQQALPSCCCVPLTLSCSSFIIPYAALKIKKRYITFHYLYLSRAGSCKQKTYCIYDIRDPLTYIRSVRGNREHKGETRARHISGVDYKVQGDIYILSTPSPVIRSYIH